MQRRMSRSRVALSFIHHAFHTRCRAARICHAVGDPHSGVEPSRHATRTKFASVAGRVLVENRNLSPPLRSDIAMVARYILGWPEKPEVLEIHTPPKQVFELGMFISRITMNF